VAHTCLYRLSVALPLLLGTLAAVVFHAKFSDARSCAASCLPMMATPSRHRLVCMSSPNLAPQLPAIAGRPSAQLWVFHPATVIPSLVLVETWQWTPLVMLDAVASAARGIRACLKRAR